MSESQPPFKRRMFEHKYGNTAVATLGEGELQLVVVAGIKAGTGTYEPMARNFLELNPDTTIHILSSPGVDGSRPDEREEVSDRLTQYVEAENLLKVDKLIMAGHSYGSVAVRSLCLNLLKKSELAGVHGVVLAGPVRGPQIYRDGNDLAYRLLRSSERSVVDAIMRRDLRLATRMAQATFNSMPRSLADYTDIRIISEQLRLDQLSATDEPVALYNNVTAILGRRDPAFPFGHAAQHLPPKSIREIEDGLHNFPAVLPKETAQVISQVAAEQPSKSELAAA